MRLRVESIRIDRILADIKHLWIADFPDEGSIAVLRYCGIAVGINLCTALAGYDLLLSFPTVPSIIIFR